MPDNTSPPTRNTRPGLVSLRKRFIWLLAGVVGMFTAGMTLSMVFSVKSNERAEMRLLAVEARQTQANILQSWGYYRELVDNLARDPHLIDLLQVGTPGDLQAWATSRQRLLPNILGLALVSPAGEVYGDASLLRVGPSCQRDLLRHHASESAPLFVHRDVEGLEHVDLVAHVQGLDKQPLGKVFVSFRLAQLKQAIDSAAQPGHVISILDATGTTIVSSGAPNGVMREVRLPLPAMQWQLVVQSSIRHFNDGGLHILAGLLTLAGVLILLLIVVGRLRRPVQQDIQAALDALTHLTRNESAPAIHTRYVEFEHATQDINRIAQQLNDQREQLARLSLTDPLTGLPNRRAFENRFSQAIGLAERNHPVGLVLIDIDHFKGVNDRFGHGVGDQVLLALAQSLKALTRRADIAARLGGDEFAVLLTDLGEHGVNTWYQRLADHFTSELNAYGLDFQTGLSAGHTWLGAVSDDSIDRALVRADHALYQAKARGRSQLVLDADVRGGDAE